MACRIGINGFGRIGRMILRRTLTMPDVEVVAVNDLANIGDLAYLLKYDSVHGLFPGDDLGCNVYITKPVEYEQFTEAICKLGLFMSGVKIPEEG
jgi:glyceraldehyde-3-phosphate dehydrogenase/erythrose-4-phosphate dehydrogenase